MSRKSQPIHEMEPLLDCPPAQRHHRTPPSEIGHWVRTAGLLAPLVIAEVVKDHERQWRFIRISSVAMALVSEGFHARRIGRERREREAPRSRQLP